MGQAERCIADLEAFVLCDTVWRDVESRKTAVIGIFTTLESPEFPAAAHPFFAFIRARLSDSARENRAFRVEILLVHHPESGGPEKDVVTGYAASAPDWEPTHGIDIGLRFDGVPLLSPGRLEARLLDAGHVVARAWANIVHKPKKGAKRA